MSDTISIKIKGAEVKFRTQPGVFSKKGLDKGSQLLLENAVISDGTIIADLGCGSGVIGFISAKLNPLGHVDLFDANVRAIELAKKNVELNNLPNVHIYLSDIFNAVNDKTYHLILSNPPQQLGNLMLEQMADECFKHLKPGGKVIWVMQQHLQPFMKRLFQKHFGNYEVLIHGKGYVLVQAVKS